MENDNNETDLTIFEVKDQCEAELRELPNVTGVGVGPSSAGSGLAIKLYVDPSVNADVLPNEFRGYPVEVERLAPLRKQ